MAKRCCCSDPGCSCCEGACQARASTVLYRVDMEDEMGWPMCEGCAEDAYDSGLFRGEMDDEEDGDICSACERFCDTPDGIICGGCGECFCCDCIDAESAAHGCSSHQG